MATLQEEPEFERLPDLYQRWVEQLLPAGIPREREATCLDCAMCAGHDEVVDADFGYYNPATKCCTYFPELPNFLAGRAMANDNPGAAALRAIVEDPREIRGGATLRSVQSNAKIATLYAHHSKSGFGRDPEMLCPYVIDADGPTGPRCGIWKQRNAVCSTWFCKHGKGMTGVRFWQTLQGFFTRLEWSLSWWAITQVLVRPGDAISAGTPEADLRIRLALRPDAWKLWPGSRRSFYESCAEAVEDLSMEEAIAIGGIDAQLTQMALKSRFEELHEVDLPERLRVAPYSILRANPKRATLQAKSGTEPIEAPAALLPLLPHFVGDDTEETLESIREQTQIRLDPKLVRRLYDFGLLERVED